MNNDESQNETDENPSTLPDPNGPPEPMPITKSGINILTRGLTTLVAGGGLCMLVGSMMLPTVGATRSPNLKWEKRQSLIEEALKKESAESKNNSGKLESDGR